MARPSYDAWRWSGPLDAIAIVALATALWWPSRRPCAVKGMMPFRNCLGTASIVSRAIVLMWGPSQLRDRNLGDRMTDMPIRAV
jgi:hypothetical protein